MKNFLGLLLVFVFSGTMLQAKHNGDYLNKLNGDYVTEHYDFFQSRPAHPLRVLFILRRGGARDAIEIGQRMPLEGTYFLTNNWHVMAREDIYESAMQGTTIHEKEQELSRLLDREYDVCVVGRFLFERLPEEDQYRLLKAVEKGMGLVLVHYPGRLPYKRLFRNPLPDPEFVKAFPSPSEKFRFSSFQMAKGRVVKVVWGKMGWGRSCLPVMDYSNQWKAAHENSAAFMGMVCRYAAGRETVPANPKVRIRNVWNEDVTGRKLPGGVYFKDEIGSNDACRVSSFTVPSPVGKMTLKAPETVKPGKPFECVLNLEKALPAASSVKVELFDSPYHRIWYRRVLPLAAGKNRLAFTLSDYPMPTLAGYVRTTIMDKKEQPLAVTDCVVFFPDPSVEDYIQIGWDSVWAENGELLAPQLVDRLGWRLGLAHSWNGGENIRAMALLNQKAVNYAVRINMDRSPKGGIKLGWWFFLPKELQGKVKALDGDECFYRPEVQELWRAGILFRIQNLSKYSTAVYNLGDENCMALDGGYGPSDLIYFRKFLQKKYGSIEKLNYTYGTRYKNFDEVPHLPLKTALQQKNYAAWADHRAYMEKMYADIHAFLREEIRKVDPGARVGAEGSVPCNLEQTIEPLEYWGPYSSQPFDELLRSFGPDKIRTLWWGGYPGSHSGRGAYPMALLQPMLLGTVSGNAWFSTEPGSNHSCFDCDMDFADYLKRYLPEMDRLAAGTGQLLVRNRILDSGVLFYWSHPSMTAQMATGKTVSPRAALPSMINTSYRLGQGFEFVSSRTLDRLQNARLLYLCGATAISDAECRAIKEFVRRGGLVIADTLPAIMDENLRIREKNPLADLFGEGTYASVAGFEPVHRSLDLPGGKAPRIRCLGDKLMQIRKFGEGTAVLANFALESAANTAQPAQAFDRWMAQQMSQAGVQNPVILENASDSNILRLRQGADFVLAGLLCNPRDMKHQPRLKLSGRKYVYAVDGGYLGRMEEIVVDSSRSPLMMYSLFEQKQKAPRLKVSKARLGEKIRMKLPKLVDGRVLRLEITNGEGQKVFTKIFDREAIRPCPVAAYTDVPGIWKARLTDVATGLFRQVNFEVKP